MYNEQIHFTVNSQFPVRTSGTLEITNTQTKKGLVSSFHFHDEYEFLCVKSGCMKCMTDEGEVSAYAGDIIFVNSRVPHSTYRIEDNTDEYLVQFKSPVSIKGPLRYVSRFLRSADIQCCVFSHKDESSKELADYITRIMFYDKEKPEAYEHYVTANLYMIVAFLHKHQIVAHETSFGDMKLIERIMPALNYIDENYSEQMSLETLSDYMGLNPSYFCRLFKKAIGSTFTEYLNFVRVCKAEHLLKHGSNISDTAYNVGFSSLSYFNRIFKKYKLCSPSDYKKISRKHEHLISEY